MSDSKPADTNFESGAVRSAEAKDFGFTSLPWLGVIGVARTSGEGAAKYGRYNYMLGMPVHDLLEHVLKHQAMFILGDRSEPHLEHAAWGLLAAIQSYALDPALSDPHLLGPGATLTPEVVAFLDANKASLAEKRAAGVFSGIGGWDLRDIPEVARLLAQRESAVLLKAELAENVTEVVAVEEAPDAITVVAKVKRPRRTKAQIAADNAAKEATKVEDDLEEDAAILAPVTETSVRFDDSDPAAGYTGLVPMVHIMEETRVDDMGAEYH